MCGVGVCEKGEVGQRVLELVDSMVVAKSLIWNAVGVVVTSETSCLAEEGCAGEERGYGSFSKLLRGGDN
jgi:hypothetical protein